MCSGISLDATVRTASSLEDGKADVVGLYMVSWLHEQGLARGGNLMDNYVTFLAAIAVDIVFQQGPSVLGLEE